MSIPATQFIYRSAITGLYVTKKWALAHPETTMRMTQQKDRELCATGMPAAAVRAWAAICLAQADAEGAGVQ